MTTSGLASPLPAVRPREERAEQASHPTRVLFQPRDKPPFLRLYGRALGFSVLVHLLLLALSPRLVVIEAPGGGAAVPATGGAEQATYLEISLSPPSEVVPLSQISASQPAVTAGSQGTATGAAVPTPPGSVGVPGQTTGAGATTGGGAVGPAVAGTPANPGTVGGPGVGAAAAATLRPGYRDSRLYVETPLIPDINKTPRQRYAEHLSARMEAVRDSIAAEAGRADLTPDWVRTDGSGNRWGLSDEGLHLGGITIPRKLIPTPRPTGDTQSQQAERERQRQREEIQRQEADRDRRAVQEERNRAAQEAREADR